MRRMSMNPAFVRALSIGITLLAASAWAGGVTGVVDVEDYKGQPEGDLESPVVVYITNLKAAIPDKLLREKYVMATRDKQFRPQVMVIPVGATVYFPNQDPIIHNVFSVSGDNKFDAGRFGENEGASHTFPSPGLARIYCNVHHQMNAILLINDNPYFTYADKDGRFTITGLPDGDYTVAALHRLSKPVEQEIRIRNNQTVTVEISLSLGKKRVLKHLNKFGKPYPRTRVKRY